MASVLKRVEMARMRSQGRSDGLVRGEPAGDSEAAKDLISRVSVTALCIAYMVCVGVNTVAGGGGVGGQVFHGADLAPGGTANPHARAGILGIPLIHQAIVSSHSLARRLVALQ